MGDMGLLLGLGIDATQAEMELGKFGETAGRAFQKAGDATKPFDKALLSNRESARLLSEEMGLHLPRAVTGAVAEMLPPLGALSGALLAAYAVKELPAFIHQVHELADTWGGFNDAVKKGFQEDVRASDAALTHFQGLTTQLKISTGELLISQTQAAIVRNEVDKQALLNSQTNLKTLGEISAMTLTFGLSLIPLVKNKWDLSTVR